MPHVGPAPRLAPSADGHRRADARATARTDPGDELAADRLDPIAEPCQAAALRDVDPTGSVVLDRQMDAPVRMQLRAHLDRDRPRMLRRVRERLCGDEVEGALHDRRERGELAEHDRDVECRAPRERAHRRLEPALAEDRGVDSLRELAQLAERLLQLRLGLLQQALGTSRVAREQRADEPETQRERDEALLGAVVQVALDLPARLVRGLGESRARGADRPDVRTLLLELAARARVAERHDRSPALRELE